MAPSEQFAKTAWVLGSIAVVVTALYLAKGVLVPLTLAALLSFLLSPVCDWLERRGLGRIVAVLVTSILGFAVLGIAAWAAVVQMTALAPKMPEYQDNIQARLHSVNDYVITALSKVTRTAEDIGKNLPQAEPAKPPQGTDEWPYSVRILSSPASPLQVLGGTFGTLVERLGSAGIVIILVVFFLTPLTVCLLVIGKHIPQLSFLDILLGNEPVFEPKQRVYQRLLAGDQEEAADLVDDDLENKPLVEVYDTLLIPVLALAETDWHRGELDEGRHKLILQGLKEMIREWDETEHEVQVKEGIENGASSRPYILCLAARSEADEIAGMMLARLSANTIGRLHTVPIHCLFGTRLAIYGLLRARIRFRAQPKWVTAPNPKEAF